MPHLLTLTDAALAYSSTFNFGTYTHLVFAVRAAQSTNNKIFVCLYIYLFFYPPFFFNH